MELFSQLIDFIIHLDKHLEPFIKDYGGWTYGLLFAIVFCETGLVVTPILPGDSLLFAAGAFAGKGMLSYPLLIVLLIAAAVLGDSVNYAIGQFFGQRMLAMKRFRLIQQKHLDVTHEFFEKYGPKTIVIARFVPIVRTIAPFVAGLGKMSYAKFMTYNVAGAVAWVLICTTAGYLLANNQWVGDNFSAVVLGVVLLSVLPAVWEFWRARRARDVSPPMPPPALDAESGENH